MCRLPQPSAPVQYSSDSRKLSAGALGNTQVIRPPAQNSEKTGGSRAAAVRNRLAYGLRKLQRPRVALCRTVRTSPSVQLVQRQSTDGSKRLIFYGVTTCGSVHSCPTCAAAIMTRRAEEITQALAAQGRDRTAIVTLTLRHHAGVPLRVLRTVLGRAWSEMFAGRQGQELRAELGLVGCVRAAEQTWGQNGWHPHLHCLLFFDHPPPPEMQSLLTDRWLTVVRQIFGRLWDAAVMGVRHHETDELRQKVARLIGARFARAGELKDGCEQFLRGLKKLGGLEGIMPDVEHAVKAEVVGTASAATYLSKLGCELTGIMVKEAKKGSYTSWAIAAAAAQGEGWAIALWREHADAMFGARQLTWSTGLRDRLGLEPERPDAELAAELENEPGEIDVPIVQIEGETWDLVCRRTRQLFLAELHEAFASGRLGEWQNMSAIPRDVRRAIDVAPTDEQRASQAAWSQKRGAEIWARGSRALTCREEQKGRPWVPWSERQLQREELAHHIRFELGITSQAEALSLDVPAELSDSFFPLL